MNLLLEQLANVRAFIMYRLDPQPDGSLDKVPIDPSTGYERNPHDPDFWMPPGEAELWVDQYNRQPMPVGVTGFGVGVIISEQIILPNGLRLFCLDIDKCRDGDRWLPHATSFCERFPGAFVEVSVSRTGLHVFGCYQGERPDHGVKNKTYRMELYTRLRFIALADNGWQGSVLADNTDALRRLASEFFPPHDDRDYGDTLSECPVPEWSGPDDDDELIRRAMRSHSAAGVFGGKAAFAELWTANAATLAKVFPAFKNTAWDESAADQALANHLAFWTGNHGTRMERIMQRSQLKRWKWSGRAISWARLTMRVGRRSNGTKDRERPP